MIGRIVFIARPTDDANMRRIARLRPSIAIQAMLSDGLRALADKLEEQERERVNAQPESFAQSVEDLFG